MLEEAIMLIEKQRDMYKIQNNNLLDNTRTKTIQKVKNKNERKIRILNYILDILKEQKKEETYVHKRRIRNNA